ncbi:hypothetical protein EVAR_12315_1 [Eumeta japonica]|uniref:Uncharacterized protein n=1 Tax=Eumeta variegata TaxID=151549 RepID=A0A4C1TUC9_EUMVA|nr:hypothetical protein EVAR_12315_1 [Eumeta japonica]
MDDKNRRPGFLTANETKRKDKSKPLEEREEFWTDVREILVTCDRNERIIILDNFNGGVREAENSEGIMQACCTSCLINAGKAVGYLMNDPKLSLYPTVIGKAHGSRESWIWQKKNESGINAVEMRSLYGMYRVSQKDRCRNSDVSVVWFEGVVSRVKRVMLRLFGHLERMSKRRLTKEIYRANVCDGKIGSRLESTVESKSASVMGSELEQGAEPKLKISDVKIMSIEGARREPFLP